MTTFPIEHWQERAVEVSQRYNPHTGRSRMANNAFADLAPEFAGHSAMLEELRSRGRPDGDGMTVTRHAAGDYFVRGLEHCGVFAGEAGIGRFLESVD